MRPALSHRQNGGGSLALAAATKRTDIPTPYQLRTKAVFKAQAHTHECFETQITINQFINQKLFNHGKTKSWSSQQGKG